jgi:hypothetical protein
LAVTNWVRSPNSAARITRKLVPATRVKVVAVPSAVPPAQQQDHPGQEQHAHDCLKSATAAVQDRA